MESLGRQAPQAGSESCQKGAKPDGSNGPGCFPPLQNSLRYSRASMEMAQRTKLANFNTVW